MKKHVWTVRPRTAFGQVLGALGRRYFAHDVARDSAALTYYLLFAVFPLLIFISTLIGALHLEPDLSAPVIAQVVPAQVRDIAEGYLRYVTENSSRRLMWFSLIFSVWFPMRSAGCLLHSLRKAFSRGAPGNMLREQARLLAFTLVLIVTIGAALALTVVGRRALEFLSHFFALTDAFISAWSYLRFVLLFVVLALTIGALYMLAQGAQQPRRAVWPGVASTLLAWMLLSAAFSYYVEHVAHYAALYGSIAAIVVALLWLYMSAVVVIMGAELTAVLAERRRRAADEEVTS